MKTIRKSNIELLRIIAMLMIVGYHIYCHCISIQLTDASSAARMNNGFFNKPLFFKKILIPAAMAPLGKIGDTIFILISGYFLVPKGRAIDLIKTTKKLFSQLLFSVILLTVFSAAACMYGNETYLRLSSFTDFYDRPWFIGYYFLIIVFAALFLNGFLESLDRDQYKTFLFVVFGITQFSFAAALFQNLASGLAAFCVGVFLYALGGYIDRYDPFGKIKIPMLLLVILLLYSLVFLSTYNSINQNIEDYVRKQPSGPFIQRIPGYEDRSFLCVAIGIAIFEIFKRIDIGRSRGINTVSSATLMVYLVHDHPIVYSIWDKQDWITLLYRDPLGFILKWLLWIILTFTAGVLAYALYCGVSRILVKIWKKMTAAEQ